MKVVVYRLNIYHNGHYHQRYRFTGRMPTAEDVLEAIARRRGDSRVYAVATDAYHSEEIVKAIGIPGTGDLSNAKAWEKTWRVIDVEVGKLHLEKEEVWLLEDIS